MFIYTLTLFFTEIAWASPVELLVIVLALLLVLFLSAPLCADNLQHLSLKHYLFSAWIGVVSLSWVFWPFFIILNISLYVADTLAKMGLLTVSSWDDVHLMLLLPTFLSNKVVESNPLVESTKMLLIFHQKVALFLKLPVEVFFTFTIYGKPHVWVVE